MELSESLHLQRVRESTRGCQPGCIFLNSAGSSLPPSQVVDAHVAHLHEEELRGVALVATDNKPALEAFYPAVAQLLGCSEAEVAFTESATRAFTLLLNSIRFFPGERIVTSASDYGSNFVGYLQAHKRWGVEIIIVPDDHSGQVDLDLLRAEITHPRTRLVSIGHAPTGGGHIQPAEAVGKLAREFGVLYLLDACQTVGQIEVNVEQLHCDMLTASGRKFLRGPRGTGFLYVRGSCMHVLEPQMLDQTGAQLVSESDFQPRRDARCFEQFEYSFGAKVGLAVAINYALGLGISNIAKRVMDSVEVTDIGTNLSAIVTFCVPGKSAQAVREDLLDRGVEVSVSAADAGSRVWFHRRGLAAVVRASPHYFNTEEEIDRCVECIHEISKA